jgi:hypothetical protein
MRRVGIAVLLILMAGIFLVATAGLAFPFMIPVILLALLVLFMGANRRKGGTPEEDRREREY